MTYMIHILLSGLFFISCNSKSSDRAVETHLPEADTIKQSELRYIEEQFSGRYYFIGHYKNQPVFQDISSDSSNKLYLLQRNKLEPFYEYEKGWTPSLSGDKILLYKSNVVKIVDKEPNNETTLKLRSEPSFVSIYNDQFFYDNFQYVSVFDIKSGQETELVAGYGSKVVAHTLFFARDSEESPFVNLYKMDIQASAEPEIALRNAHLDNIYILPNGSEVVYTTVEDFETKLILLDLATQHRKYLDVDKLPSTNTYYSFHPEGLIFYKENKLERALYPLKRSTH